MLAPLSQRFDVVTFDVWFEFLSILFSSEFVYMVVSANNSTSGRDCSLKLTRYKIPDTNFYRRFTERREVCF